MNKYQESLDFVKKSYPQGSKKWKDHVDNLQELIDRYDEDFYNHLLIGNECEVLNLYVKDLDFNLVRKVGTDCHDTIYTLNNDIYYYNLQNGGGCSYKYKGSSYKFVKGGKDGK